jgi:WD40 repeat protein
MRRLWPTIFGGFFLVFFGCEQDRTQPQIGKLRIDCTRKTNIVDVDMCLPSFRSQRFGPLAIAATAAPVLQIQARALEGHTGSVNSVAFSPDGHLLASGGDDKTVRVWDARSGECLHVLEEYPEAVMAVAFSPDGRLLAGGCWTGELMTWDTTSWECLREFEGSSFVVSETFSPDSQTLACGGSGCDKDGYGDGDCD